ncbi:Gfo/Idh/MocA family protein [Microlunatus soli]|uniref:Predicted dehydrogenase n=1 Tax=Microlunatus soli TaxID=630515 RepID=A0A1H1YST7_9ACTN|nr:Gfo/Idh/MocA family oxidoreductase [Microlunatus soli]SDT24514.1 Predicted dehydrogenase [Microlunatus soli]
MTDQDHRDPVRVALAGGTGFGLVHRRNLARLGAAGRAELVAVADPAGRPDDLERSIAWHPSLDDLLAAEDCSVVIVATPIHTHAPLTEQALRAGKHVYLEKPPVASMAEFERVEALLTETGLSCQVGFQALGSHAFARIAELIGDGAIGEPRLITGYGVWSRTAAYFARSAWSGKRRLGDAVVSDGVATNALAHSVAQALRLAGIVDADRIVTVSTELYKANRDNESDDTTWIGVRADGALPLSAALTLCGPGDDQPPTVSVVGDSGRIDLQYTTDLLTVDRGAGEVETEQLGRIDLTENLLDHLADGTALISPFTGHQPYMTVLEAIQSHDPVPLSEGVTIEGSGPQAHPVIKDIEQWARQAAETGRGFAGSAAPWATSRAFRTVSLGEA